MGLAASYIPLPKTLQERLELPEMLEMPATLGEYFDFADGCEYRVEYADGKIISMGYATLTHEALVGRMIYLLTHYLGLDSPFHVLGSNVATQIPAFDCVYNGDVVVVHGQSKQVVHQGRRRKMKALLNPWLIVEIASKGTRKYDRAVKLPRYQTIASLEHILLVDRERGHVSHFARTKKPDVWLNSEITDVENGSITLNRRRIKLADIFRNVLPEEVEE